MLTDLDAKLRGALARYRPWTDVYGLARSMIALATAGTLAANRATILFRPGAGTAPPPFCDGTRGIGAFCLAAPHLDLCRWLCVAALLVVASGWRPRVTGIVHWWIAFSLQNNALIVDGGDQVAGVLALLLLPVCLTDSRRWHWAPAPEGGLHARLLALFGHGILRLQLAGIYFHAAVGKLTVPEWKDGTAMYYWSTHETFGAPPWIEPFFRPLITHGATVAIFSWSVIVLELMLSVAFLMHRRAQRPLMVVAMAFHVGIIFVHGLPSFGSTMIAALLLYLQPWSVELHVREIVRRGSAWVARLGGIRGFRARLAPSLGQSSCAESRPSRIR
jgi:antimicrobial peptide system SdpB family protein